MWINGLSPLYYTKLPSLRGDLARHVGCRPRSLNICPDSRMGSCWPRKKSNLSDSHENKAQDKRNLGAKDAANGYLTPKEPNKSRITGKRSFNFSCQAQDKRNLGAKDAANGYLTPKEPNESRITGKRPFNFSCLSNHSKNSVKVEVLPSDQRWSRQC
jgi:hypothetical protein